MLGTGIAANPNLGNAGNGQNGRSAQTIVNEVTQSGPPSLLAGTIEVFGAPAAVIIANPNGITCNGCGVLNTPRLSLITASSSLQGGAGFASAANLGWDVQNGQIVITSQGLEGAVGRLDLLGQTIQIQGPLRAHYLNQDLSSINLGAGRQQFQLQGDGSFTATSSAKASPVPGAPAAPANSPSFAIDASALGAMTAGQIHIVSTSEGLGVNLRGPLVAYQQGIHINSAGALTVNDASAVGDIHLVSGGKLTTTQNLNAGGAITASSGAAIQLQGNTLAVGNIQLQSGKDSSIGGSLQTGGDLDVQAGSIHVSGGLQVQRDLTLKAGDIAVNANLTVGRNYSATASNTLVQDGNSRVGNNVSLQANATTLGGSLAAPQTRITGGSLLVGTGAASTITGDLLVDVQGRVEVRDTLSVHGGTSTGGPTGVSIGGNLGIQAGSIQIGGTVLVERDLQLQGSDIAVNARLAVGHDYSASASNTLVQDGNTRVGNSVSLQAKAVTLGGTLAAPQTRISGASLIVGTSGATSITGKLLADLQGPVQVRSTLDVQGDASISSASDQTFSAPVNSSGTLSLQTGGALNLRQGASAGGAALLVSGGALSIAGPVSAGEITASGASADINGALNSVGNIHVAATGAGGNLTLNAPLQAGKNITVQSGGKLLANSSITSNGATQLSATDALEVTGTISASSLGLSGAGINVSGALQSPGSIALSSSQSLDIGGDVRSGGAVNLQTAGSLSVSGSVTSAGAATLVANRDLSVQGSVNAASISASAGHDASFGGNLTSSAGAVNLNAGGNLTVAGTVDAAATAGAINLQSGGQLSVGGSLRSATSIQLIANGSASIGGLAQSGATTVMQSGGDLQLLGSSTAAAGQTLHAGGNVDVQGGLQAGALDVQGQNVHIGGAVDVGGTTQLQAANTLAVDGHLQAGGAIAISAGAGGAALRQVQGNGNVGITSLGNIRTDALTAGGDLSAQAGGSLQVQGVFGANGNLRGAAGQSITGSGTAQAGGTLQLDASVGDIQIQGDLASRANLNANAGGNVTVQGSLQTGGDLQARAGGNLKVGQDTLVHGQAQIQTGGDSRGGGALQAGNGLQLQAGGAVIQQGATLVLGDASVASGGAQSWGQTRMALT